MGDLLLFRAALRDFRIVRAIFAYNTLDEFDLEGSGFNLEQSVEKTLKGYLDFTEIGYHRTHSLGDLISMTENSKSKCVVTDWLRANYSMLTQWEVVARYPKDLYLGLQTIKESIIHVKEFLSINGISDKPLNGVDAKAKEVLKSYMPTGTDIVDPLYWNVLYRLFGEDAGLVQKKVIEKPFDMDIYFKKMNIVDKAAEIAKLKLIYNTDDMSVIKREAKRLVDILENR